MAFSGNVPITGFISPTSEIEQFATHDSLYGKGGWKEVGTTGEMYAITTDRRREGMAVFVTGLQKAYILKNGIANSNWTEFIGGGGGVPTGGSAGQVLYKVTNTDFDTGWKDLNVTYTNPDPVPSPGVGGIPFGATFYNKSMTEMWTALLYPYQSPSFPTFSIFGQNQLLEVGTGISADRRFDWTVGVTANITSNSISIKNFTDNVPIATGLSAGASPYTSTSPAVVGPSSATTKVFRIEGTNTNSLVFNKDFSVNWQWRIYWGGSGGITLNQAGIKNLQGNTLAPSRNKTYILTGTGNSYKYFCWPDVFGSPATITANGFAVAMATQAQDAFYSNYNNGYYYGLTGVVNSQGVTADYRVYRTFNELGEAYPIIIT
jgi:hypothetical protein